MQNIYPLFEQNRILKKELLWSIRDYSFSHLQIEYQEYGQGILQGCAIKVKDEQLVVDPGIIKYGSFICLMMEEERIHYKPCEQMQYLKVTIEIDQTSLDYITYRIVLLLDLEEKRSKNEFELCRFNLRSGAKLRNQYNSFSDMETEYDTINLIHADWSGLGGKALSPGITRYFAETVLNSENSQPEDRSFAYFCLCKDGAIPVSVLAGYLCKRTKRGEAQKTNNIGFYKAMCAILKEIEQGEQKREKSVKERCRILVD